MPKKQLPVDEQFAINFKKNGGKFIYCVNPDEIYENFSHILKENDWESTGVLCFNNFHAFFPRKNKANT